jgi:NADH-quinone oxidoreductase subunit L
MGGLKKDLPITYWTFLIGALAISGFPLLSGFFSKDEILYQTYVSGNTILWGIGALTALLTATYMFRLIFLTFHGERAAADPHAAHDAHGAHGGHGNGHGHLHDAPPSMAIPLIILAIGSVVAGYIGVPAALGGGNHIEKFLESSFHPLAGEAAQEAVGAVAAGPELQLMIVSTVIALLGIGIASYFFLFNRKAADGVASAMAPVRTLLLNKYYVDELYDAVIVQPIKRISETVLWKGVDAGLIDGTVNGVGRVVRESSGILRLLQTGSVRAYAASLFFGVVLVLGYYLYLVR